MDFASHLVIVRGGGDLGTGVVLRLHNAGISTMVLELPQPLVVRRSVALATAVLQGQVQVETLRGVRVSSVAQACEVIRDGAIPVLIAPELEPVLAALDHTPTAVIDARVAKRNIDTRIDQAPLVIGLGPGFTAGVDCHAVIETMRGHTLGRVLWQGPALPDTGTPGLIVGKGKERVLRAPATGVVRWLVDIGDQVREGQELGTVEEQPVRAPFDGVVRGLIAPGMTVHAGLKIGDVDARGETEACFTVSDKGLALGGAVLEALLAHLSRAPGQGGYAGD